jgi:hypothetical protein
MAGVKDFGELVIPQPALTKHHVEIQFNFCFKFLALDFVHGQLNNPYGHVFLAAKRLQKRSAANASAQQVTLKKYQAVAWKNPNFEPKSTRLPLRTMMGLCSVFPVSRLKHTVTH